ncbi:unnamed protein product [Mytilus coruscus]|uniref:Uncharacterized protein n=1 Tax=Mytilus coruscus TaxID=42192 RepID=A0A6J7ZVA4_MYTCO|nr:unnamed protein product [Mytilus coruscus]
MSDTGIIIPPVNALNNPVSNQAVEVVALHLLNHDYEEIDETAMNDIPDFQNIQLEDSESDSTEGSHSKPSEDAEGYLNPYHSLVHPHGKCEFRTVNPSRKGGSPYSDHNPYDCLNLAKPIGYLTTKSMSHGTIVKTSEKCSKRTTVNRITI